MHRLHHDPARIASPSDSLQQAAHYYADAGWPVFPCRPGAKIPVTLHGYLDATVGHAQIDRWWTRMPSAAIGIATGAPGPDVLDVDVHGRNGFAALRQARQAGLIPTPIRVVRTPSGGAHLYFPGTAQRSGALPGSALDFRAAGGSVIAPPSWSAEHQRSYELLFDRSEGVPVDWVAIRELLQPTPPSPGSGTSCTGPPDDAGWSLGSRPGWRRGQRAIGTSRCSGRQAHHCGRTDGRGRSRGAHSASLRSGLRGGERRGAAHRRQRGAGGRHPKLPYPP